MGQCNKCKWYKQDKSQKYDWGYRCRYRYGGSILGSPDDTYYNQDREPCPYFESERDNYGSTDTML